MQRVDAVDEQVDDQAGAPPPGRGWWLEAILHRGRVEA
jgi:hypothetical protein